MHGIYAVFPSHITLAEVPPGHINLHTCSQLLEDHCGGAPPLHVESLKMDSPARSRSQDCVQTKPSVWPELSLAP
jgi:hypothetical protein